MNRYTKRRPTEGTSIFDWLKVKVSNLLRKRLKIVALFAIAAIVEQSMSSTLQAQEVPTVDPSQPLTSLKTVSIPEPSNLAEFVTNKTAALVLGKSLFWDMQTGSDNIQSCASCHFHAGADNRSKHQLSPGLLRVNADGSPNPDTTFNTGGLNYQLKANDYPFTSLQTSTIASHKS